MSKTVAIPRTVVYSSDDTVTTTILAKYNLLSVDTAGVNLTLPTPSSNYKQSWFRVQNDSTGPITVSCNGYFLADKNQVVIGAGRSADFSCARTSSTSGTYRWACTGGEKMSNMTTFTSTLTWTTGTPTSVSQVCEYQLIDGKVCLFTMDLYSTDGNGATALTATLPVIPQDTGTVGLQAVKATQLVNATYYDAQGYIDLNNGTAETRAKVQFKNFQTCTDAAPCGMLITGWYPVKGTDFDATATWTTSDPGSITTDGVYIISDNVCFATTSLSSADSNIASDVTVTLPVPTPDRDGYSAAASLELAGTGGATYSNPHMYVDCAASSDATRLIETLNFTQGTDAKAIAVHVATITEIGEWISFDPTLTWTTGTPSSITEAGRYIVQDGICYFHYYLTSADGNGATALTISLPVGCAFGSRDFALCSTQLVNSTYSDPGAYIPGDQEAAADRNIIAFRNLSTCTDAATVTVYVSGWYPVS